MGPGRKVDGRAVVIVRVERFVGHGAHVHVSMTSRDNQRYMKFRSRDRAHQWVRETFKRDFDPATHELRFESGNTQTWFYPEGD